MSSLSPKLEAALNEQLNFELASAYAYFSMAAWFSRQDLDGFMAWMEAQAQEELTHVKKFFTFINDREGKVISKEIPAPPVDWNSTLDVFEHALAHERKVTARINNLMKLADEENDYAVKTFLQWFIEEQVEEEAMFGTHIGQLKRIDGSGHGLFMMDMEFGKRGNGGSNDHE